MTTNRPNSILREIVLAALVALGSGAALAISLRHWHGDLIVGASSAAKSSPIVGPVLLSDLENGFASILKPILPAVVNISSSRIVQQQGQRLPYFSDPLFRRFFGEEPEPRRRSEQSLGSGVIVSSDGTILTNNHVIDGATDIKVFLDDNRELQAQVVGTDPKTDVAVLKIPATQLPTLALTDSSKLQVGDIVLAVGDPFGIGKTATMGIVSAIGRGGLGIEDYEDFIQTDASINPGNSGGALIDLRGNLIGINTAILAGNGGENQGIGFAIPIDLVQNILTQIQTHGKVVRGYLGVSIQTLTPELAEKFGLKQGGGVLISDIVEGSPAFRAGLKRGDVILQLSGEPVEAANQFQVRISQLAPNTRVDLQIWREGKAENLNVGLGELSEEPDKRNSVKSTGGQPDDVGVQTLSPDIARQLHLPVDTRGVVVISVDSSSAAAAAGLDRGVVIEEVNHKRVTNLQEYHKALAEAGGKPVLVLINREGARGYIVIDELR